MPRRYGCRVRTFHTSTHPHFPYFPCFPSWHATTLRVPGPNLPSVHTSTLSILPILPVVACHDATGAGSESSKRPHIHTFHTFHTSHTSHSPHSSRPGVPRRYGRRLLHTPTHPHIHSSQTPLYSIGASMRGPRAWRKRSPVARVSRTSSTMPPLLSRAATVPSTGSRAVI